MEFAHQRTCSTPARSLWKLAVVFALASLLHYGERYIQIMLVIQCVDARHACLYKATPSIFISRLRVQKFLGAVDVNKQHFSILMMMNF